VTDIDERYLESLHVPNLEVRRHDIVTDPLPEAAFDLIHARLVLIHLPQREEVLSRLVAALKPGGWLVDEEFDSSVPSVRLVSNGRRYSWRGDNRAHSATVRTMHRPAMPMVAPPGHQHARRINFWPASACIKSPRPRSFFHLTFDESEKVGVDPLRIDDCDTVSATLVDFQDRVRNDRWYAAASRTDRHDLIVFAVYDE
jgi:SAM-dependent methyltransferase